MTRWDTRANRPRSWVKMATAALVLSAAFIGGGAALTPNPAIALISDDNGSGTCSPDVSWFDQFECSLGEEGGGEPTGGGGPTPGGTPPPAPPPPPDDGKTEVIPVQGTAPTPPTKVIVGTRRGRGATGGENDGAGRGTMGGGGRPPRAPACQKDKAGKCVVQKEYMCRLLNGQRALLGSARECDFVRKQESRQRRLRTVCLSFLDTMYSSARAIEAFTAQAEAEGLSIDQIRSEPDVAEAFSQNEEARQRWFAERCYTVFPELKGTDLGRPPTEE
jgi:hypothetical protein